VNPDRAERIARLTAQILALADEIRDTGMDAVQTYSPAVESSALDRMISTVDLMDRRLLALRLERQGVLTDAAGTADGLPC
jgi:hypothetical protein